MWRAVSKRESVLRTDLVEKLDGMISYVDYIEERSPQILDEYRMRLESKVQELLGDRQLDDARIAAEITIFADKICVDEETVRLKKPYLKHEGDPACRRRHGQKARLYCAGDEPRGEHHPLKDDRS